MSPIETIIIARTISVNVISLIKSILIKTPIIYVKYTTLIIKKLIYHQEVILSKIFHYFSQVTYLTDNDLNFLMFKKHIRLIKVWKKLIIKLLSKIYLY